MWRPTLAMAMLLVACGPAAPGSTQGAVIPSTTTPPSIVATSAATPTTSGETTIPPSTAPSGLKPVGVLLANPSGVFFFHPGSEPRPVQDGPVLLARDDLAGGLVMQVPDGDGNPGPVIHAPAASEPEVLLAPQGSQVVLLEDVEVIGGVPTAVVTIRTEVGDPEAERQALATVDLGKGDRRQVAVVGGFESVAGPITAEIAGFVVQSQVEAMSMVRFLTPDGTDRSVPFNPNPGCLDDVTCPTAVVASPDGARFAYLQVVPAEGVADGIDLVVVEARDGTERARVGLPVAGFTSTRLDLAGNLVTVDRLGAGDETGIPNEPVFPLLVDISGEEPVVTEVPMAGSATVARTEPAFEGTLR